MANGNPFRPENPFAALNRGLQQLTRQRRAQQEQQKAGLAQQLQSLQRVMTIRQQAAQMAPVDEDTRAALANKGIIVPPNMTQAQLPDFMQGVNRAESLSLREEELGLSREREKRISTNQRIRRALKRIDQALAQERIETDQFEALNNDAGRQIDDILGKISRAQELRDGGFISDKIAKQQIKTWSAILTQISGKRSELRRKFEAGEAPRPAQPKGPSRKRPSQKTQDGETEVSDEVSDIEGI